MLATHFLPFAPPTKHANAKVPIADDLPPSSNSVTGDAVYRLFSDLDLVDPVNILLHVKGLAPDYVQTLSDEEKDTFCSALQKDVRDWRMRVRAEGCCVSANLLNSH